MTPGGLRKSFKSKVADKATPPLWSDDEIVEYMNWAIEQFCFGWGGIADSSSPATLIKVVASQPTSRISPKILKIKDAWRVADYQMIEIFSLENLTRRRMIDDYGFTMRQAFDARPGPVYGVITNMDAGELRWVNVPTEDQDVRLSVLRLPLKRVTCASLSNDDKLEIPDEFEQTLVSGMCALAYEKQDAETFDKRKAAEFRRLFKMAKDQARKIRERRESKVRVVKYGGL